VDDKTFDKERAVCSIIIGGLAIAGLWYLYIQFLFILIRNAPIETINDFTLLLGVLTAGHLIYLFTKDYLEEVCEEIEKWKAMKETRRWIKDVERNV